MSPHRAGPKPGTAATPEPPAVALGVLLRRSILAAAALAMVLFALPLGYAVGVSYDHEAFERLAHEAERVRASMGVSHLPDRSADPWHAATTFRDVGVEVGVYAGDGVRLAGRGPQRAEPLIARVAASGLEQQGRLGGDLVVAVPVTPSGAEGGGGTVVRAAEPRRQVWLRVVGTWLVMVLLGAGVMGVVWVRARSRERAIGGPLQALATSAEALGRGDFSIRARRAGVVEIDAVGENLERTARRLAGMLERERAFSADASHQLRTPLTAVRVGLEAALVTPEADLHAAVTESLTALDRLEQTVLDLLALARDTAAPDARTDVGEVAGRAVLRWRPLLAADRRELWVTAEPGELFALVSAPALRTVLDVLLDNALRHGRGGVDVTVGGAGSAITVRVRDEGRPVGDPGGIFARRSGGGTGTGIGLALARTLVEADGGRLELTDVDPTAFTVFLPAPDPARAAAQRVRAAAPGGP